MLSKTQKKIDEQKWLDSEKLGCDTCGTYKFCNKCDKSLENPCATAKAKLNKKKAKLAASDYVFENDFDQDEDYIEE